MNPFKLTCLLIILVLGMASVNAQDSDTNVAITLERQACFGTCPIYTVSILENGTVIYTGQDFVDVTGEQTSEITPETVALMVETLEEAGYFDWDEAYDTQTITDMPTVITSVTRAGETHRIVRYEGDSTAPLALAFLEHWIDQMVNTQMWTGVEPDISRISNGTDTPVVTLQRGECFGFCPTYSIAVFADGTIVYTGVANVDNIGVSIFESDPSIIESITMRAQAFGYFHWKDSYEEHLMTDQATVITSIRWEDQYKRIVRYDGDPNAPIGLVRIEDSIDQVLVGLVD